MHAALDTLIECLRTPSLPFEQADEVLASLTGRLPARVEAALRDTMRPDAPFPAAQMRAILDAHVADVLSLIHI